MTDEHYDALMDYEVELTQAEIDEGWHFCWCWDGLLVGPGMGEMEFCHCKE